MKKIINEIRRAFVNPLFFLSVGLQFLFLYLGGAEDWPYAAELDSFYLFAVSQEFGVAHLFLPILVFLPYCLTFIQEMNSGYTLLQLHRMGRREWVTGKTAATILSGATAVALGTLLYACACLLFAPSDGYRVAVWRTYADGHWLEPYLRTNNGIPYLFLSVGLSFLSGLVWSGICMLLANLCANAVIVLLAAESVYLLCTRVPALRSICDPVEMLQPSFHLDQYPLEKILQTQACLFFAVLLVAVFIMRRKSNRLGLYQRGRMLLRGIAQKAMGWLQISPAVLLVFALAAILRPVIFIGNTMSRGTMLLSLTGGIPFGDEPSVSDLAQWILLWLPCMIHVGLITQHEFSSYMYIRIYRFGGEQEWIKNIWKRSALPCVIYILLTLCWIIGFCALQNITGWTAFSWTDSGALLDQSSYLLWLAPTLLLHGLFVCTLQICITLYARNSHTGSFVTLLIIMSSVWFARKPSVGASYVLGNMGIVMRFGLQGMSGSHPVPVLFFEAFLVVVLLMMTLLRAQHYNKLNKLR